MVTFCNYFCKSNYFPIPAGIGNGTAADNSKNRFGGTPMQTLWNSRDTLPAYPPLREDLHADAAVVGGGIAGILMLEILPPSRPPSRRPHIIRNQ